MRVKIIRFIIVSLFIMITIGLIYFQAIRGQYFYNLSTNNRIRVVPLEGWRGRILDRNGFVLADNRMTYDVMITPQDVVDIKSLFRFLSEVLGVNQDKIMETYRRRKYAPFAPVVVADDLSREKAMVIEENKYRFPSLFIQENYKRLYPYGRNSAHVLGYVGQIDLSKIEEVTEYGYSPQAQVGKTGVEEHYDAYLRGQEGGLQIEVNSRGQQVRLLSIKKPVKGQDITLTIDSRVQQMTMELLEEKPGAIVVLDMNNGEILGMTSSPDFDLNIRTSGKINSPFLNRAIKGVFPPGSVFKVLVALAALDSQKISVSTTFKCVGYYELGQTKFGCTHAHGQENLIESLVHSCNIYYYHLGLVLGENIINRYARLLGLGRLTRVDLPYEKAGLVPGRAQRLASSQKRWYTGDTLNLSIGQGDTLVTPLQLARMIATVARNGIEVQPHVLMAIDDIVVNKFSFERQMPVSPEAFQIVKKGLRAAVTDNEGTAHVLDVPGLYVAGKTGTAQSQPGKEHHAWFVGYIEGQQKDIAFCVFLEHGGSSHNACLLAKEFLLRMQEEKML
ncbi:MAG TPA: penicillin-binding protein 2 [Candidatus Omnitrophica bacterium]|nr:MAG: penicillin-binding protein 2 [Omnitrophica WOR_2 bacterium GWA2_45_18]HBR14594.1 penicillin-binding protein 2 [Candidatus Omnitrophota bacterium]